MPAEPVGRQELVEPLVVASGELTVGAPPPQESVWGLLAIRDYRLHLVGGLAFSASLWVVFSAVGWVALELTDSPSRDLPRPLQLRGAKLVETS